MKETPRVNSIALLLLLIAIVVFNPDIARGQEGKIVPYVPTPQEVVDRMLELAQVKKGDVLYDLGSGDGRIVVTAAKKYGVRAIGFEIDPERIKESAENIKKDRGRTSGGNSPARHPDCRFIASLGAYNIPLAGGQSNDPAKHLEANETWFPGCVSRLR